MLAIDRISLNSLLLVAAFVSVLVLSSQSGASFVTYILALTMLLRIKAWNDLFHCTLVWPILALLIYLPLTSFWSEGFSWVEFGSQAARALLIFTFVAAFAECQLRGDLQAWLVPAFVYVGALVALVCIINFYVTNPEDGRLNGLGQLDTQVVLALVFGFAILAGLHALINGAVRFRFLLSLALLPLLVAVVLAGSRAAWVALGLGVGAILLAHRYRSPRGWLRGFVILLVVVACTIALSWSYPEIRDLVFPRGDSFRFVIWEETLNRIAQYPWFGNGILTVDDITANGLTFYHAHNLYLSVAFQGGLVGLALFAWMLIRTIRELLMRLQESDARFALAVLAMSLPAYLLDGHELLDKISDTWFLIWLPAAVALGLRWHSPR